MELWALFSHIFWPFWPLSAAGRGKDKIGMVRTVRDVVVWDSPCPGCIRISDDDGGDWTRLFLVYSSGEQRTELVQGG